MGLPVNLQELATGQLLQTYRDTMMALGRSPDDQGLLRQADRFEEEVARRMAW